MCSQKNKHEREIRNLFAVMVCAQLDECRISTIESRFYLNVYTSGLYSLLYELDNRQSNVRNIARLINSTSRGKYCSVTLRMDTFKILSTSKQYHRRVMLCRLSIEQPFKIHSKTPMFAISVSCKISSDAVKTELELD